MNSLRLVLSIASIMSLVACGSSAPATPPADASTSANASVTAICANAARLDCPLGINANCARAVMAEFDGAPARCAAQRDAFFACAARATTTTCAMIAEGHFAGCTADEAALGACAGGAECGDEGQPCCAADGGPSCSGTNRCESGTCRAPF